MEKLGEATGGIPQNVETVVRPISEPSKVKKEECCNMLKIDIQCQENQTGNRMSINHEM